MEKITITRGFQQLIDMNNDKEIQTATKKIGYLLIDIIDIWQEVSPKTMNINIKITSPNHNNFNILFKKQKTSGNILIEIRPK